MTPSLHLATHKYTCTLDEMVKTLCKKRTPDLSWVEPAMHLPRLAGKPQPGRLKDFKPLVKGAPAAGLQLAEARLYYPDFWLHLLAGPASGRIAHWSEALIPGGKLLEDAIRETDKAVLADAIRATDQTVLLWRDRARFGLTEDTLLPQSLCVRSYYQGETLVAWRFLMGEKP